MTLPRTTRQPMTATPPPTHRAASQLPGTPPAPPASPSPEPGRLLLVEPDLPRRQQLAQCLRDQGHAVQPRAHADGLARAAQQGFELVLMNPAAPLREAGHRGDDAWWQLRGLRHDCPRLPVIVLQRQADSADRTVALELGADAVLDSATAPRELAARVTALLRRQREQRLGGMAAAACAGWLLDCQGQRAQRPDGRWLALSRGEYRLLRALMQHPGQALGREPLLDLLGGPVGSQSDRSIDLLVSRLRRRLGEAPDGQPVIQTLRGVGYSFCAPGPIHPAAPFASSAQHGCDRGLTPGDDDDDTGMAPTVAPIADTLGRPDRRHVTVARVGTTGVCA